MKEFETMTNLLKQGLTQPEIAVKLKCSLSSVEKDLKALKKLHGAKTMFQLGAILSNK